MKSAKSAKSGKSANTSAERRATMRAVRAQRKKTGRSAGGGLHVVVKESASGRLSLSKIDPQKLHHGKRLHGCIHHVGGDTQRTSLTAPGASGFEPRAHRGRDGQVSVPREQLEAKVEVWSM